MQPGGTVLKSVTEPRAAQFAILKLEFSYRAAAGTPVHTVGRRGRSRPAPAAAHGCVPPAEARPFGAAAPAPAPAPAPVLRSSQDLWRLAAAQGTSFASAFWSSNVKRTRCRFQSKPREVPNQKNSSLPGMYIVRRARHFSVNSRREPLPKVLYE